MTPFKKLLCVAVLGSAMSAMAAPVKVGIALDVSGPFAALGAEGRPDSLALPLAVVLRFRLVGERRVRGLCIPRDALTREAHRRLRVRLKFSRRRWAAPG